jgi:hypothetical protein
VCYFGDVFGSMFKYGDMFGSAFFCGVWITQKLSAIFEALIVSDVNKLVVRVL